MSRMQGRGVRPNRRNASRECSDCPHSHDTSLFPRLVLGCINTDFGNQHYQIVILQHFSKSTKYFHWISIKSNMMKFHDVFMIFTEIIRFHQNPRFSLMISIINSRHLCGKPPTLLRDSGSKNPLFFSKSAFFIKKKDDLI